MIGRGTLLWIALAGMTGYAMFQFKVEVIALEEELAERNRDILAVQESIHVLTAEWAYLNDPARLAALAERHLALAPPDRHQLVALDALDRGAVAPAALPGLSGENSATTIVAATENR